MVFFNGYENMWPWNNLLAGLVGEFSWQENEFVSIFETQLGWSQMHTLYYLQWGNLVIA